MEEEEKNAQVGNEGETEADRHLGVVLKQDLYWSELDIVIRVRLRGNHHRNGDRVVDGKIEQRRSQQ